MVEIIHDMRGLESIAPEWNMLAGNFENPLLRHEWFASCAEAFYNEKDLRVVVLRSHGDIIAIAPLAIIKRRGVERLELLGVSSLFEPCGLLYDGEGSLQELLLVLLRQKRPLYLQRLPAGSPVFDFFRNLSRYDGLTVDRRAADSVWVRINGSWKSFYGSLSAQRRYDYRRAARRSEQYGAVEFKVICPEHEELELVFNAACEVEAKGWKGQKGSALLHNKKMFNFFRAYTASASRDKMLRICLLNIAGALAAMQIGVEFAKRFWVLKIGYDEQWAKCSPGMQLTMAAIRYAFDKGLEAYEFLGSDEPWLHVWTGESHAYRSVGFYPIRPAGLYGLGIDFANYGARKIFR